MSKKKPVVRRIHGRPTVCMVPTDKPRHQREEINEGQSALFAGEGIQMAVVRDGQCRWPFDVIQLHRGRCCGEKTDGQVYCARHTEIATRGAKRWEENLTNPFPHTRFI